MAKIYNHYGAKLIIPPRKLVWASCIPINRLAKQGTVRANLKRENAKREWGKREFDLIEVSQKVRGKKREEEGK